MIVGDAIGEYLSSVKRRKREPRTVEGYRQRLGVFAAWCISRSVSLEQFSKKSGYKLIDEFVAYLEETHPGKCGKPLSSTTLRGYVICIKMFFKWCLKKSDEFEEYIHPIILERVEVPQVSGYLVETFSDEQTTALLAACELESTDFLKSRNRAIVQLLVGTGIRVSELCMLTMMDTHLDPEDAHIKVIGKGRKWREVPLDEESRRLVGRYMRRFRVGVDAEAPLFVDK